MTTVIQGKSPIGLFPKFLLVKSFAGASSVTFLSSDQRDRASFGGFAISANAVAPTGYAQAGSGTVA